MKTLSLIWAGFLSLLLAGCSITPTPRADNLSVLPDHDRIDTEFSLKKGFWVYLYRDPIVILNDSGRVVWYRMTAATGNGIGGRRLVDFGKDYFTTLHIGTRIRLVGVMRYKDGTTYIVEVVSPDNPRLKNALIEIHDQSDDYEPVGYPSGAPKLSETFFRPLHDYQRMPKASTAREAAGSACSRLLCDLCVGRSARHTNHTIRKCSILDYLVVRPLF